MLPKQQRMGCFNTLADVAATLAFPSRGTRRRSSPTIAWDAACNACIAPTPAQDRGSSHGPVVRLRGR